MRRVVIFGVALTGLLWFQQMALAGTGSKTALADGHTFTARYYSTECNSTTSVINSVGVDVTVPGARIVDDVCVTVEIYSQGRLVTRTSNVCKTFGPGLAAATKTWCFSCQNVQVRRGCNQIKVWYSYVYCGLLNQCNSSRMTGAGYVSLTVP